MITGYTGIIFYGTQSDRALRRKFAAVFSASFGGYRSDIADPQAQPFFPAA